ncbi:MAG: polymer-forming cytoskeletal protein [Dehalococcoidia bacterium]|nr:polymer-forming cytoskeletal protein [Dehalococcoidia bacterium]
MRSPRGPEARPMRRSLLLLVVLLIAALPTAATAQGEADPTRDGLVIHLNDDYTLPAGERADSVVVVNGNANIEGELDGGLVVINGDSRVEGTVAEDIFLLNGTLTLGPEAEVNDVNLVNGDLVEEPGATILGNVDDEVAWYSWSLGAALLFGLAFWFAATIGIIAAGLLFAAVGGRQLYAATRLMSDRVGQSILTGLIAMIGLPLAGVFILLTVAGIPLGLGILLFLMPAIVFLGYLVAGAWLGSLIIERTPATDSPRRPFASVSLGLLIFQVLLLIPGVAPLIFLVASVWGAGGMLYLAWLGFRGHGLPQPSAPTALIQATP